MLRETPPNSNVILIKVHTSDPKEWKKNALALEKAADRAIRYLAEPLPKTKPIEAAHNQGRSVWTLPRRGRTKDFLQGIETLVLSFASSAFPKQPWPAMPPLASTQAVAGWDDNDDDDP
jgi:hypothetical protein